MLKLLLTCLGAMLIASCYTNVFGSEFETCDELLPELQAELQSIQSCTMNAECGQVITGTSCGCTNDTVVRIGADASRYRSLLLRGKHLECGITAGTCDCPAANGFVCKDNLCSWNYVN